MPFSNRPNTKYQQLSPMQADNSQENSVSPAKEGLWAATVRRVRKFTSSISWKRFFGRKNSGKRVSERSLKSNDSMNNSIFYNNHGRGSSADKKPKRDNIYASRHYPESAKIDQNLTASKMDSNVAREKESEISGVDNKGLYFETDRPDENNKVQKTAITPKQITSLTQVLKERRKQVQQFIFSTQQSFMRYGPSPDAALKDLTLLELNTLKTAEKVAAVPEEELIKHRAIYQDLIKITNDLKEDFAGLRRFVKEAQVYDFRSGANYYHQVEIYKNILPELVSSLPAKKQNAVYQALNRMVEEKQSLAFREGELVSSVPTTIDEIMELYNVFKKVFTTSVFNQAMIKELEKHSSVFESKFHFYLDGKWKEVTNTYVPPAVMCLQNVTEQREGSVRVAKGPFEHSYEGKLSPALLRKTKHAVNMLDYSMKIDEKEITKQIRVGCPYAYAEKEVSDRKEVTMDRIKEIFTALLMQNHATALQAAMNNPEHSPIELNSIYFNLLSPDNLRGKKIPESIKKISNMQDEKMWVVELHKMFKDLAGKPLELKVRAESGELKKINILPNVKMFVAPCNSFALKQPDDTGLFKKKLMSTMRYAADTWKVVNQINNESLDGLYNQDKIIAKKLHGLTDDKAKQANTLTQKIHELMPTGKIDFEKVTDNYSPFYFAELMIGLAATVELDVLSGCKSDKDRTSLFKSAIQSYLVTNEHLHVSQKVKDESTTSFHRLVFELFMLYGGHLELQKRNCGIAGFRIDKTPSRYLESNNYQIMRRAKGRKIRDPKPVSYPPEMFTEITLPPVN